ncbi:MAG: hypothetical protein ABI882_14875 [Acidobacteriota bacterium]
MEEIGQFALTPMSAGDIIDRAVSLYRRHFLVLLRIVLPPSLVAYLGGILLSSGVSNFSFERGERRLIITVLMVMTGLALYVVGKVAFFAMLGGTSRALVGHFAWGVPITSRSVFQSVRARWWQLTGATIVVLFLLAGVGMVTYMVVTFVAILYVSVAAWLLSAFPNWVQIIAYSAFALLTFAALLFLAILVYARIVFVPQALMVEGKGVFSAVARSITLAGGDTKKVGAILAFQVYIAWSLLLLLVIPLGWYGYLNGVDINPFGSGAPLWYNIAQQTVTQISEILLAPIVMVSFTLLYLDVRIRREGFDVELLANRTLPAALVRSTPSVLVVPEVTAEDSELPAEPQIDASPEIAAEPTEEVEA